MLHLFSHSQPIATGDFLERAAHVVNWMRVDGKLGGRGPALCFCGGLGVDKPRSLGGLTPVRNKSETQCYHDPRRPGLAVRMFVRPFVWAACAQHIHVNLRPGCFQISRANPKRPQLLNRVLETHWRLFGSCVRQNVRGLGVDKPRSLGGSDACLKQRHNLRRPGSAVRMFVRPFVWPSVLSINIFNVLPSCFQISRANPKRPQLLKRGFVLETHRRRLSCSRAVSPRAGLAQGRFLPVASPAPVSLGGGFNLSRASPAPVSLGGGFRLSRASTAPVSLAGGFRTSRASTAPVSLQSRSGAVSRGRFRPVTSVPRTRVARGRFRPLTSVPHASLARGRFPLVTSVHRASLARGRFRPVTSVPRTRFASVSLGGGFGLSRASPTPVSLGGGFGLSRASPAPVSLGGGFGLSRALARGRFRPVMSVPRARLARGRCPLVTSVHLARGRFRPVTSVRSGAVSACHERPPRPSRSGAVSACHERPPRARLARGVPRARLARGRFPLVTSVPRAPSCSGAVSACHERFCMSQASPAPVSVSACHERPPRPSRSGAVSACHKCPPRPSRSGAVLACHERPPRPCVPRARLARGRFWPVTSVPRARLARGRFPLVTSVHRASLARRRFPHAPSVHRASLARGRLPPVTSVPRARLARGRFPLVTSVHRASRAHPASPTPPSPQPASYARSHPQPASHARSAAQRNGNPFLSPSSQLVSLPGTLRENLKQNPSIRDAFGKNKQKLYKFGCFASNDTPTSSVTQL